MTATFLLSLFFCNRPRTDRYNNLEHGNQFTYVERCPFCNVSKENGFNVVWENDKFIAFKDRSPSAEHHIQLVPKTHIDSVKCLGKSDATLVRTMADLGRQILGSLNVLPEDQRMGFHIPPMTSVRHLHLHLQGLPYNSIWRAAKYPLGAGFGPYSKGFSWFVDARQAAAILESGNRIRVFPC